MSLDLAPSIAPTRFQKLLRVLLEYFRFVDNGCRFPGHFERVYGIEPARKTAVPRYVTIFWCSRARASAGWAAEVVSLPVQIWMIGLALKQWKACGITDAVQALISLPAYLLHGLTWAIAPSRAMSDAPTGSVPHHSAMNSAIVPVMRFTDDTLTHSSTPWMLREIGP